MPERPANTANVAAASGAGLTATTLLPPSVTVALSANSRPSTVAAAPNPIEVEAKTFPSKTEEAPRVAELPTCQNTWLA